MDLCVAPKKPDHVLDVHKAESVGGETFRVLVNPARQSSGQVVSFDGHESILA